MQYIHAFLIDSLERTVNLLHIRHEEGNRRLLLLVGSGATYFLY